MSDFKNKITYLLFIIFLIPCLTQSQFMQRYTTEEMVKASNLVVTGKVESRTCRYYMNSRFILSDITISVNNVIIGSQEKKSVVIQSAGGKIGNHTMTSEGEPKLEENEAVLLFLKKIPDLEKYNIFGLVQGKFSISEEPGSKRRTIKRDMSEIFTVDKNDPNEPKYLDEFIELIKKVNK
jgi:hypothetical protein